ncbi:MAG: type II toxin-antitoxin system VapC family toxin [Hormoscilla sp. SP5CHS1]|nr:type II toxin-antitoxin system VapC family toxin [Hormoscilla sp. SP5CHS1]
MSLWILDTDYVSLIQREEQFVTERLNSINTSKVAITVITVEEQMRGRLNSIRQASQSGNSDRIIFTYANLRSTVDFYRTRKLLDFDRVAATRYAELSRQKIRIQLVHQLASTGAAFCKPVLKRSCSNQHHSQFN